MVGSRGSDPVKPAPGSDLQTKGASLECLLAMWIFEKEVG